MCLPSGVQHCKCRALRAQRYIIRIIFMVPFYGVTSWLSLMYRESSIYFDVPRDWWVVGGEHQEEPLTGRRV